VVAATASAKKATAVKDQSAGAMHCQACLEGAFAADRPVVEPVARRSCECHEEALGVTDCLTKTIPAAVELMEFVLENAEQPVLRVEKVAVEALLDAATVAIGLIVVVVMPLDLVVLRRYCFGKRSYVSQELM